VLEDGPTVAVVCWPDDRATVAELTALGVPRLLLLSPDSEPLDEYDELEDWVRLPVADVDARSRIRQLRARAASRPVHPLLDGRGRLMYEGRWVVLSETEERLAGPLVEHFGAVVRRPDLFNAGWPSGPPTENACRPTISRLRRRCAELGLDLTNVRGVGYTLSRVTTRRRDEIGTRSS
jgi:hypothetical protein